MGNRWIRVLAVLVSLILLAGCGGITVQVGPDNGPAGNGSSSSSSSNQSGSGVTSSKLHFGVQTKTSGCQVNGKYPDPGCTPGAIFANVTKDDICVSGYSKNVRNVPQSEKDQVYAEYEIASHTSGEYEVDHFVSLELGGSNDIANLWPEAASPKPGFHEKDKVENYLHEQVCNGTITLAEAQREIATDWYAVYQRMGN